MGSGSGGSGAVPLLNTKRHLRTLNPFLTTRPLSLYHNTQHCATNILLYNIVKHCCTEYVAPHHTRLPNTVKATVQFLNETLPYETKPHQTTCTFLFTMLQALSALCAGTWIVRVPNLYILWYTMRLGNLTRTWMDVEFWTGLD